MKNEKVERTAIKRERSSSKASIESGGGKAKRVSKREKKLLSYVDLANGTEAADLSSDIYNQFSRTSVIRTSSIDDEQYQEEPVDFSAKRIKCEDS